MTTVEDNSMTDGNLRRVCLSVTDSLDGLSIDIMMSAANQRKV